MGGGVNGASRPGPQADSPTSFAFSFVTGRAGRHSQSRHQRRDGGRECTITDQPIRQAISNLPRLRKPIKMIGDNANTPTLPGLKSTFWSATEPALLIKSLIRNPCCLGPGAICDCLPFWGRRDGRFQAPCCDRSRARLCRCSGSRSPPEDKYQRQDPAVSERKSQQSNPAFTLDSIPSPQHNSTLHQAAELQNTRCEEWP